MLLSFKHWLGMWVQRPPGKDGNGRPPSALRRGTVGRPHRPHRRKPACLPHIFSPRSHSWSALMPAEARPKYKSSRCRQASSDSLACQPYALPWSRSRSHHTTSASHDVTLTAATPITTTNVVIFQVAWPCFIATRTHVEAFETLCCFSTNSGLLCCTGLSMRPRR